jgi:MFS transporter, ACS family, hexuronate transporter
LVFASMVINYIDRQTFIALSPILRNEFQWTHADFATLLLGFRVAYTLMQAVSGRILDRLGTRRGLALGVAFYSLVAALTAGAHSLSGFRVLRCLLGLGEASNWPGAIKASAEWFEPRQRAWAVALFDAGTALGGVLAPFLALALYGWFQDWRPVCVLTASLGGVWVAIWLACYRSPADAASPAPMGAETGRDSAVAHGPAEREAAPVGWRQLLACRQTWGIMAGRFLLDPYWFFIGEWFAIYLDSRGFALEQSVLGMAAPLAASIVGNFAGGALSSGLIRRGWSVGRSRRAVLALFGPSMIVVALALVVSDYATLIVLFSYGNFAYSACSTMFLSLPADVFHPRAVASASGLSGTAAGAGTILSTWLIGQMADRASFAGVVLAASLLPALAALAFVCLVRAPKSADPARLVLDF